MAQWVQTNGVYGGDVRCLTISGTNIFVGTGDGVFLSTNNGTNWTQTILDSSKYITAFVVSGANLFAGTWGDGGDVFRSTNNGASWSALNTGWHYPGYTSSTTTLAVSPKMGGDGITTLVVTSNGTGGTNLLAAYDCGVVGAYPCDGVYLSSDNGTSWTQTSLNTMEISNIKVSGKNLFAGTYFNGIFCSTDNGTSWTAVNNGLTNPEVFSLAVSDTNLFAGTSGGGIFHSTSNGISWTEVSTVVTHDPINCLAVSGKYLFAGTWEGSVFLFTNNGTNWTAVNTGLLTHRVWALAVFGTNLFAGTSSGVWRRPLSEMTSISQSSSQLAETFSLSQNYPNPFNPSTTISFSLPTKSFVTLKIFDVLGKQVSEVVSEELLPGNYSRQWNASNMPSGMYFYRLSAVPMARRDLVPSYGRNGQAGSFTETKKLLLLR
ncbi:MAG: T9SS type A sorting domain-containing protein [Ignavibacteriales bacterium]|nr:T9SS type A sorting domain-containing protein [Ignavibacteriales bacterium]